VRLLSTQNSRLISDFHDHFDFDGVIGGKLVKTDRGTGMTPRGAKDFVDQIGATMDDIGGFGKTFRGVDHAKELDDLDDLIQVADQGFDRGESVERTDARGGVTLLDGQVAADLADVRLA
jgi:hypothetical protein